MQKLNKAGWSVVALALCLTFLPAISQADDDNDNAEKNPDKQTTNRSSTQQGIMPANATPDLEIVVSDSNARGVNQVVNFMVTNRGKGPSEKTIASVTTLRPEPTLPLQELDVKALAPGESTVITYTLAVTCDGHVVLARVNAPNDSNAGNDSLEWEVCPPPIVVQNPPEPLDKNAAVSQIGLEDTINDQKRNFPDLFPPQTSDSITEADRLRVGERVSRPENLRVGLHTSTREPVATRQLWEKYRGQGQGRTPGSLAVCIDSQTPGAEANPETLMVGYEHTAGSCTAGTTYQVAFKFDFSDLNQFTSTASAGALEVKRADLLWENVPGLHRGSSGELGGDRSCIGDIGLLYPGPQFEITGLKGLIDDYPLYQGVIYKSQELYTLRVDRMIHYPTDNNGFLLRGRDEDLTPFTIDNGACISLVSNFKLTFTYEIRD